MEHETNIKKCINMRDFLKCSLTEVTGLLDFSTVLVKVRN